MKLSTKITIAAVAAGAILTVCFTALTVGSGGNDNHDITIGEVNSADTVVIALPDINTINFIAHDEKRLWVYLSDEDTCVRPYLIRSNQDVKHPYIEMDRSWKKFLRTDTTDSSKLDVWLDFADYVDVTRNLTVRAVSPVIINIPPSMIDSLCVDNDAIGAGRIGIEGLDQSQLVLTGDASLNFRDSQLDMLKIIGRNYDEYRYTNLQLSFSTIREMLVENPYADMSVQTDGAYIGNILASFTEKDRCATWSLDMSKANVDNFSWTSASPKVEVKLQTGRPYSVALKQ